METTPAHLPPRIAEVATPLYTGLEGGLRCLQPSTALVRIVLWVFAKFSHPPLGALTRQQLDQFNEACGDGAISDGSWEWLMDAFPFTPLLVSPAACCAVECPWQRFACVLGVHCFLCYI